MASGPAAVLRVRPRAWCATSSAVNVQLSNGVTDGGIWPWPALGLGLVLEGGAGPVESREAAGPSPAASGGGALLVMNAAHRLLSECVWLAGITPALSLMPVSGEKALFR